MTPGPMDCRGLIKGPVGFRGLSRGPIKMTLRNQYVEVFGDHTILRKLVAFSPSVLEFTKPEMPNI